MVEPVYHSQVGQDRLLDTVVFRGMENGVVVDIGAHDGVHFSNSLAFERDRGWRALCVEPHPDLFPQLAAARPGATCVNLAVGAREGTQDFTLCGDGLESLSCLTDDTTADHHRRVAREAAMHGGTVRRIEVPVTTPAALFAAHGIGEVHFLSVDTEGSEPVILGALEAAGAFVHVVAAECNRRYMLPRLKAALGPGFVCAGRHRHDAFFVNRASPFASRLWPLRAAMAREALAYGMERARRRLREGPKRRAPRAGAA